MADDEFERYVRDVESWETPRGTGCWGETGGQKAVGPERQLAAAAGGGQAQGGPEASGRTPPAPSSQAPQGPAAGEQALEDSEATVPASAQSGRAGAPPDCVSPQTASGCENTGLEGSESISSVSQDGKRNTLRAKELEQCSE